jgi:hypothetical protein
MADRNIERAQERDPVRDSNDVLLHQESIAKVMANASEIIRRYNAGGAEREAVIKEHKGRGELSRLLNTLRQIRRSELREGGIIDNLDSADGSYDRRDQHRELNGLVNNIRNLDISLNRMWGSQWIRRTQAWFQETMPNWWTVEWRAFKDNAKHFLTAAGVVGVAGAGLTIGGYALANGGLAPGLQALGGHLSQGTSFLGTQLSKLLKRTP